MKEIKSIFVCLFLCGLLAGITPTSGDNNFFYVYNASNGLSDNSAQTITCTKTGRLVITTMGQINFFDGQKFTYIDPSTENIYTLSNYQGNYHLYFDKYHHLWLKDRQSVTCVNLITERFVASIEEVFAEFGITEPVKDLFVDERNEVWIMTEKGLYSTKEKKYYDYRRDQNLQDLSVYGGELLLLFYDDGHMDAIALKTGIRQYETSAYDSIQAKRYNKTSVVYANGKNLYQIRNGERESILMHLCVDEWQWHEIHSTPYHMNNIAEHDSILYIPSQFGYWTYDLQNKKLVHEEQINMITGGTLSTDVNAIAFDKQNGMWLGTQLRGLMYARPYNSPFNVYPWSNPITKELMRIMDQNPPTSMNYHGKMVNCVYKDSRGWDWVGTSSGLQLYKSNKERLPKVFTRSDGLLNNVIHTIIEDKAHNIWIGTSWGLSCLLFNGDKYRYILSYDKWDKIPGESFTNGRAFCAEDGTIIMQMLDHIITFNPENMMTVTDRIDYKIFPKLIKLLVNGSEIRSGEEFEGNVILDRAISRTRELNLNYDQNSLSLTFSALNYFRPQQTYYRVRVEGIDNAWRILTQYNSGGLVDSRGQLHLPLTGLRPGSYKIEIQASMLPDTWNTEPYEWVIKINEPWWRTTGMLMLLGSLISILFLVNVFIYIKNTNKRTLRNTQELGLIKRIKQFADRCINNEELLEPTYDQIHGINADTQNELSMEFIDVMSAILPVVQSKKESELNIRMLSATAEMEVSQFYQLIIGNIYKSPRPLVSKLKLKNAIKLLEQTNQDLSVIAAECGYISVNCLIAEFYHHKKMTPKNYRLRYGKMI